MRVLVVGSTGLVGRQVCRILHDAGHAVRGLARVSSDPAVVDALTSAGVEIVIGDLKSPETLTAACEGMDTVVSTATAILSQQSGDSIAAVDMDGQCSLIDRALESGVTRFVYVSVLGHLPDSPIATAKERVEHHLHDSGLTYTIVRPSVFMESWLSPQVGFDWAGGNVMVYGDGSRPQAWVHTSDVATIVAALAEMPNSAPEEVSVLGPDSLTPNEVITAFENILGHELNVSHLPVELLEAQLAGAQTPSDKSVAALLLRYAAGDPDGVQPNAAMPVSRTTLEEYARRLISG